MTAKQALELAFLDTFELTDEAANFLLLLWDMMQAFDDLVDESPVDRDVLDGLIWQAFIDFPSDPFMKAHGQVLLPLMANVILRWKASDTVEREGRELEKAYMWRAGYYDVILQVICIVHGRKVAMSAGPLVMELYGETMKDYLEEFNA